MSLRKISAGFFVGSWLYGGCATVGTNGILLGTGLAVLRGEVEGQSGDPHATATSSGD